MNKIYKIIPGLNLLLLILSGILIYKNKQNLLASNKTLLSTNSGKLYIILAISKLLAIYIGTLAIIIGSQSKKYGKYADKLLPLLLKLNIFILPFFSLVYQNGLYRLLGIASSSLLLFNINKSKIRFQGGRLANPNIINTTGFIPLLALWYLSWLEKYWNWLIPLLILFLPLFFDLKYYFDFRAFFLNLVILYYIFDLK